MSDHEQLPAYEDFFRIHDRSIEECLDMQWAAKNFYGKTLQEAEMMFKDHCIHYGEDLLWMGTKAFEFYVRAFKNYLLSEDSAGDYTVASVLDSAFPLRHKDKTLGAATGVVLECLEYAILHFPKFDIDDEMQSKNLKELIEELTGDEANIEYLKEKFLELGENPDNIRGILESLDEIPDVAEQEPRLMTVDRWKKLRDEIAAGL